MNHLQPPGSPLSPLSQPSPFQTMTEQKTIYDVIYSNDNPPEFYGHQQQLVKAGACPHLVQLKQKLRQDVGQDNILENYRSLVRYSILWHKSRKQKHQADHKKRKQVKEASTLIATDCIKQY
jgi:ubiquitin carboxyl-terminal hydrolase 22/27/51